MVRKKTSKRGIKIYKTKPSKRAGWEPWEPAKSAKQARDMVITGYVDSDAIIVKAGKNGDVCPYTIYVKERRVR